MSAEKPRANINIGDRVTVKVREQAGRSEHYLEPGMVGIVGAIEVPYVHHVKGNSTEFVCVDFFVAGDEGYPLGETTVVIRSQRARPDYKNLKKLPGDTPISNLADGELEQFCDVWSVYRRILPGDHGDLGTLADVPMGERL